VRGVRRAKSTLDAGATLERLETLGVPVIGWRSSLLAGFLATSAGLRLAVRPRPSTTWHRFSPGIGSSGAPASWISRPLLGDLAIPPAELAGDEATTARGPDRTRLS